MKFQDEKEAVFTRVTSSLPDGLTLSSVDKNGDLELLSLLQSSPRVPCLSTSSICSNQCAGLSESESAPSPVLVKLSGASEPEEVKSPAVSETEEVSSSSGSYSVTSTATDINKSEFWVRLEINKDNL